MVLEIGKVLIKDRANETYLLLYRTDHPRFGNDCDLPGGTVEDGESVIDGAVREVYEEAGIKLFANDLRLIYRGDVYSSHKNMFNLYYTEIARAPRIKLDWEHSSYVWCSRKELLADCRAAADPFMHMVADVFELITD